MAEHTGITDTLYLAWAVIVLSLLHGLATKLISQGNDPWDGYCAGFEASGKIKLKDFGVITDLGPTAQNVELIISVEGVREKS